MEQISGRLSQRMQSILATVTPYQAEPVPQQKTTQPAGQQGDVIKLDANELPFGMPPHAAAVLAETTDGNRYPDAQATALREALAGYTGVPVEHIVVGSGSDELLHLLSWMLLEAGDEVITCEPTFSMYALAARQCGAQVVAVPRDQRFEIVPEQLLKAIGPRTKAVFLCSPNNPTGNPLPGALLRQVLALGKLVVVDEAYIEFGGETALPLLKEWPPLLVLRTFSKFFGLAGLRVGYGLFPPELAAAFQQIKLPYNVNRLAQRAALAALQEDLDWLRQRRDELVAERQRVYQALSTLPGLQPFPSQGNFLLVRVGHPLEISRVRERLSEAGILVRYFAHEPLRKCFRLTIGTPEQNGCVLAALQSLTG